MADNGTEGLEIKEPKVKVGWWHWFILIAASAFVLYHLLYVSDLWNRYTPFIISPPKHLGIHLASILFFAFLLVRATKHPKTDKPPFYDVVLALAALVVPIYYGLNFDEIFLRAGTDVPLYSIFGWMLTVLLLEAARRLLGKAFTCVIAFFLFYPLFSRYLPGFLYYPGAPVPFLGEFFFMSNQGIFSFVLSISANILVVFFIFSEVLVITGAGKFFIDIAYSASGSMRGGSAKVAVIAGGLFGMLSGDPISNLTATGTFTIPLMKNTGYQPQYAAAVAADASLGGMIMPPVMGALIFILCDFIEMPYIEVVKLAAIPAVLYYASLFLMVDQEAIRLGLRGLGRETLPPFWKTLRFGWWYFLPVVVLLYLMAVPRYTPQKSVIWALVTLIALSLFRKETRPGPMKLALASEQTLRGMLMIAVAMSCAGIVVGSVSITGIGTSISSRLVEISGGNLVILLVLTAVTCFILGIGIGPTGSYVFLAVMVAPSLIMAGAPPVTAHLFVVYWALVALITPPVAEQAFVAAALAKCDPYKVGIRATSLGILAYLVPFAFVIKPALMLFGTPAEIVEAVATVVIGATGLSFGVGGHLLGNLNWPQRIICLAGGFILMFSKSPIFLGAGACLLVIVLLWQWIQKNQGTLK